MGQSFVHFFSEAEKETAEKIASGHGALVAMAFRHVLGIAMARRNAKGHILSLSIYPTERIETIKPFLEAHGVYLTPYENFPKVFCVTVSE